MFLLCLLTLIIKALNMAESLTNLIFFLSFLPSSWRFFFIDYLPPEHETAEHSLSVVCVDRFLNIKQFSVSQWRKANYVSIHSYQEDM